MSTTINISVSDPNDEQIKISVSDVIASSYSGSGVANTIIFEGVVGGVTSLTGTSNILTGFDEDSFLITLADFAGVRVEINRGGQDLPGVGSNTLFTKILSSDSILLSDALELGEYLKIKTIPK